MNLSTAKQFLLYQFNSDSELVKAIEEIGYNFTKSRDKIGEYVMSEKLVSAYTCFYLLTNIPKLAAVFSKLKIQIDDFQEYEFIDIGAGPGTFSLSLLAMNEKLDILALEKSEAMIVQGEKLVKGLYPKSSHQYFGSIVKVPVKTKKRFGIFGHSANEMTISQIRHYVDRLDLDIILFIEPGTMEFFEHSLRIRETLLRNYKLSYPCKSSSSCPMPEGDWCHQYLKIQHEPDVERLTQLVRRDRRNLPIIINFYSREDISKNLDFSRIVRVYNKTKFSLEWQVCYKKQNENEIMDLQVMSRPYKKKEIKVLGELLAGDEVKFALEKKLEDNKVRGKLI